LRNANLYRDVPLIGILEPILKRKQQFFQMQKRRRSSALGLGVAVVAFLVAFPLPMRVDGNATVAPLRMAQIQPEVRRGAQRLCARG